MSDQFTQLSLNCEPEDRPSNDNEQQNVANNQQKCKGVIKIIDSKGSGKNMKFLVKWCMGNELHSSWQTAKDLKNCQEMIDEFLMDRFRKNHQNCPRAVEEDIEVKIEHVNDDKKDVPPAHHTEYEVEDIVDARCFGESFKYLVKWRDHPDQEMTWMSASQLQDYKELLDKFKPKQTDTTDRKIQAGLELFFEQKRASANGNQLNTTFKPEQFKQREVEEIVDVKYRGLGAQYLVKWKNEPKEKMTWMPLSFVKRYPELLREFRAKRNLEKVRLMSQMNKFPNNVGCPQTNIPVSTAREIGNNGWIPERVMGRRGRGIWEEYLIKWKNHPAKKMTWEYATNLENFQDLIKQFQNSDQEPSDPKPSHLGRPLLYHESQMREENKDRMQTHDNHPMDKVQVNRILKVDQKGDETSCFVEYINGDNICRSWLPASRLVNCQKQMEDFRRNRMNLKAILKRQMDRNVRNAIAMEGASVTASIKNNEPAERQTTTRVIEKILDVGRGCNPKYLVKWKGLGVEHNSWVGKHELDGYQALVNRFRTLRARDKAKQCFKRKKETTVQNQHPSRLLEQEVKRNYDSFAEKRKYPQKTVCPKNVKECEVSRHFLQKRPSLQVNQPHTTTTNAKPIINQRPMPNYLQYPNNKSSDDYKYPTTSRKANLFGKSPKASPDNQNESHKTEIIVSLPQFANIDVGLILKNNLCDPSKQIRLHRKPSKSKRQQKLEADDYVKYASDIAEHARINGQIYYKLKWDGMSIDKSVSMRFFKRGIIQKFNPDLLTRYFTRQRFLE